LCSINFGIHPQPSSGEDDPVNFGWSNDRFAQNKSYVPVKT
jgi:hypothetical protein